MVAHADGLQMLAQHLVEVVGHLLGGPATVAPHGGDLPGRLEQGVGEPGAPQHLPVDVGGALGGQEGDQGCVEGGVLVGRWLRALVEVLGHAGDPRRRDGIDRDPVLAELERPHEGHAHDGGLGGAVVGLPEVAPQPGRRGDVDDAPVPGVLHDRRRVADRVEGALLVHGDDGVVVRLVHLHDGPVAHDPGIVHHDVDRPEVVHRRPDDAAGGLEVAHRVVVGDRAPTRRLDLLAHLRRRVLLRARAAERHADVVDDDLGPFRRQAEGDIPPDAPARTRDHRRSTIKKSHGERVPRAPVP